MSYKDEYHPRVKADLKKLDKPAVKEMLLRKIQSVDIL